MLEDWLRESPGPERILDLGSGPGSLTAQVSGLRVVALDVDLGGLKRNPGEWRVCGGSDRLPFAVGSFDLVICHHSLEHFRDTSTVLNEIRRVLKPEGRLFVSVPNGRSFSDRLYRFILCGGGHFQQFTFESVRASIEAATGLRLAGSRELFTSFIYLDRLNFLAAPRGRLPGPLPRRMRWLGRLPGWMFQAMRFFLVLATRAADRCFRVRSSQYGWALAFAPGVQRPVVEPGCVNVCVACGAALDQAAPARIARVFYRCPCCTALNFYFRHGPKGG